MIALVTAPSRNRCTGSHAGSPRGPKEAVANTARPAHSSTTTLALACHDLLRGRGGGRSGRSIRTALADKTVPFHTRRGPAWRLPGSVPGGLGVVTLLQQGGWGVVGGKDGGEGKRVFYRMKLSAEAKGSVSTDC